MSRLKIVLGRISYGAGPLATSSLAVGRFAAKQGSLRSPRGRLVASLINVRIRVDPVWFFNRIFRFSHVNDQYRKFAHLLEVGLWLRKSSWLRTCRDLILLLFLLGIHEVEVCYPSLSLLEHWCQHLCLVNPDRVNWTKFKINSAWRKLSLSGSIMYQRVFRKKKLRTLSIAFKTSATKLDSLFVLRWFGLKFYTHRV